MFWISSDKIVRMGVGLFVGVWVARYLGPDNFGVLNFAIAFVGLFSAFSVLGLDNIVIKELVHPRFDIARIMGTTFLLKAAGSLVSIVLSIAAICLTNPGEWELSLFIVIIAFGYIFQSFDVIDFWFQSKILAKYPVIARNMSFFLSSTVKIVLLLTHSPLIFFILTITLESAISAIFLILTYKKQGNHVVVWVFDKNVAKQLFLASFPLFLTLIAMNIYMKIDLVLIHQLLNDYEAGIYAVAIGISNIWYFIPTGIVTTLFPSIIRTKMQDEELYFRRMQALFDLMSILSLCLSVFVTLLAPFLIQTLYGSVYASASMILMIYVWSAVPIFLASASANFIITENMNRILVFITVINCIVNISMNLLLIPIMGPEGAAVAMLITQFSGLLCVGVVKPLRRQFLLILNSLNPIRLLRVRSMIESLQNIF